MFNAPDPEADTTEQSAQIRRQIPPNTRGEPTITPDTRPDTPDTATFSIWPLVVSIFVSAVAYFTEKQARIRTTARPRAEDYKAQRRGRAQRRRVVWGLSDYDAHSTLTRTRKPSAAVRPSAAEEGGSGVSPDYDITQHAHAHNKRSAVEKRHFSDCNATQHAHATKREQWRERERIQTVPEGLVLNLAH